MPRTSLSVQRHEHFVFLGVSQYCCATFPWSPFFVHSVNEAENGLHQVWSALEYCFEHSFLSRRLWVTYRLILAIFIPLSIPLTLHSSCMSLIVSLFCAFILYLFVAECFAQLAFAFLLSFRRYGLEICVKSYGVLAA